MQGNSIYHYRIHHSPSLDSILGQMNPLQTSISDFFLKKAFSSIKFSCNWARQPDFYSERDLRIWNVLPNSYYSIIQVVILINSVCESSLNDSFRLDTLAVARVSTWRETIPLHIPPSQCAVTRQITMFPIPSVCIANEMSLCIYPALWIVKLLTQNPC
jgi:hypothetical protein